MFEMCRVGDMDFADSGDLRRRLGNGSDSGADDQQVGFAKLLRGRNRGQRRILDLGAVVLDQNQSLHCATPRAFNLSISSSTDATLSPAWRLGGSATFSTSSRRVMSTPSSSGVLMASGFDLAFIMFGSDA